MGIFTSVSIGEKIEASCLICNLNLPITKFQFRFHNITNARAPKFLEREREKKKKKKKPNQIGSNLDNKFKERGEGMKKKPIILSLSIEINH